MLPANISSSPPEKPALEQIAAHASMPLPELDTLPVDDVDDLVDVLVLLPLCALDDDVPPPPPPSPESSPQPAAPNVRVSRPTATRETADAFLSMPAA